MINQHNITLYKQRTYPREEDVRGDYFRDQTAIIHSMPFRRLKHKTQVFFAPENDHVCTRIEHVLHVATIAATICKGLNNYGWKLEPDLAYAIGIGHDLGHAPFGHTGEHALNKILGGNNAFVHEVNSYRVVEKLANNGLGLNLTYAVKDGIICHNGEKFEQFLCPSESINDLEKIKTRNYIATTYEGCIMRFSDKIAYLGRDIEDAIKGKLIEINDIPKNVRNELGKTNGEIINKLIIDIIETSKDKNCISLSDEKYELMKELKSFNYSNIYENKILKEYNIYCHKIIYSLFDHLLQLIAKNSFDCEKYNNSNIKLDIAFGNYLEKMKEFYLSNKATDEIIVTDYISGMTDLYALECMKQISLPRPLSF